MCRAVLADIESDEAGSYAAAGLGYVGGVRGVNVSGGEEDGGYVREEQREIDSWDERLLEFFRCSFAI